MEKLIFLSLGLLLLTACVGNEPKSNKDNTTSTCEVIDYQNGVYYFDGTGAAFGNKLSGFIKDHPELKIAATADGSCTNGCFIVFEKR